jgi:hypothetical protein
MPAHGPIRTTLNGRQVSTDQKAGVRVRLLLRVKVIAGKSARDIHGMSVVPRAVVVASALVRRSALAKAVMACKTVGLAYVGSNPTPATTCENIPWPA